MGRPSPAFGNSTWDYDHVTVVSLQLYGIALTKPRVNAVPAWAFHVLVAKPLI